MALFTDPGTVTLDDLLAYENSLAQISSSHNINVDTKINLAIAGINDNLLLWLSRTGAGDPQWTQRRQLGLSTVVLSSTLQRWISFDALARFFEEAYNVQLNTRFQGKNLEYRRLADDAAVMAFASGLGIVAYPLPKPALPTVTVTTGLSPAEALFVQTAWVDRLGNESALSPVNGVILNSASGATVAMSDSTTPAAAQGWNLYAGSNSAALSRQNLVALAIGTSWQLPDIGLISGSSPSTSDGQLPSYHVTLSREIQRG